jgi:hypothetical protein
VAAIVVAVVLIAVGNTTAKKRQQRAERAAADHVDAAVLTAGGQARDHEFDLTLLVLNRGRSPITVTGQPRLVPGFYEVLPVEDTVVTPGTTERVVVPVTARCPSDLEELDQPLTILVPLAPSSGRTRDAPVEHAPAMLWDLSREACGYVPLRESLVLLPHGVSATRYAVRFALEVHNQSPRPVVVVNVTSPGLAVAVRGGVPVVVPGGDHLTFAMSASLPACSRLPALGPPGRGGALRFGTLALELREPGGETATRPYALGADGEGNALMTQLLALRSRICPGTGVPTVTGRPRFV